MNKQRYDVFISYSRKDYVDENNNIISGNVVSKIIDALAEAGISYWFDEESIYSGQNFVEKIVNNIEASKIFLFLSTENANDSRWTCKEIASADEMGKYIIPVRIDKSPYNKKVMFRISDLDYIEFYTNPEKGISDLILAIKTHLEELELEKKRKQREEIEKKELEQKKAEALKRQKEQEEKRRKEEQNNLIAQINVLCTTLNNEEAKLELDRENLLLKTEGVTDAILRDNLKTQILGGGSIHQKYQKEHTKLIEDINSLNNSVKQLRESTKISQDELQEKYADIERLEKQLDSEKSRVKESEQECEKLTLRIKEFQNNNQNGQKKQINKLYSFYIPIVSLLLLLIYLCFLHSNYQFIDYFVDEWAILLRPVCVYESVLLLYFLILFRKKLS